MGGEMAEEHVNTTKAGEMCGGMSSEWARRQCEAGGFDGAMRVPGGHWRIPLASVEAMRERMRSASRAARAGVVRRNRQTVPPSPTGPTESSG